MIERVERFKSKRVPEISEEEWKDQVVNYFFGCRENFDPEKDEPKTLKEKLLTEKVSSKDFNEALKKAVEFNILRWIGKPPRSEELKKMEEEANKDLKKKEKFESVVIKSLPERVEEEVFYEFKFYADEELKDKEKIQFAQILARQVFERLKEIREIVEKKRQREKQKEAESKRRQEIFDYFFKLRENEAAAKNYNRNNYRTDLEKAKEWGIITEKTEKEIREILTGLAPGMNFLGIEEVKDIVKKIEKAGKIVPVFIIFFDWQKSPTGCLKRQTRYFVYSGSPVSGLEQEVFNALRGRFLKAVVEKEKEEKETKREKEELQRVRQQFYGGPPPEIPRKPTWQQQLQEVRVELEKPIEPISEVKERQQKASQRKKRASKIKKGA